MMRFWVPYTVRQWCRPSHWRYVFKYQLYGYYHRARYGWAPVDTWGLDHYLSNLMAGAIDHLRVHGHTYPGHEHSAPWGDTPEHWSATLQDLSNMFREYNALFDDHESTMDDYEAIYVRMAMLIKAWPHLWD